MENRQYSWFQSCNAIQRKCMNMLNFKRKIDFYSCSTKAAIYITRELLKQKVLISDFYLQWQILRKLLKIVIKNLRNTKSYFIAACNALFCQLYQWIQFLFLNNWSKEHDYVFFLQTFCNMNSEQKMQKQNGLELVPCTFICFNYPRDHTDTTYYHHFALHT